MFIIRLSCVTYVLFVRMLIIQQKRYIVYLVMIKGYFAAAFLSNHILLVFIRIASIKVPAHELAVLLFLCSLWPVSVISPVELAAGPHLHFSEPYSQIWPASF